MAAEPTSPAANRAFPDIDPERCVHGRLATASCRRCVDACPHGALELGDACLGFDADACTGCGLCRPACPEDAVALEGVRFDPVIDGSRARALVGCRKAGIGATAGIVPCLHALGDRDLERLASERIEMLVASSGDCATCCDRTEATLSAALSRHNRIAAQRGRKPFELKAVTAQDWMAIRRGLAAGTDINHGRRALFGFMVRRDSKGGVAAPESPGTRRGQSELFRHVPTIDEATCSGCDACVRVCAHGALALDVGPGKEPRYRIVAGSCTGCNLCADVCETGAVGVAEMATLATTDVVLAEHRCTRCGAPYHTPASQSEAVSLCRICRKTDHHKKLFQVRP